MKKRMTNNGQHIATLVGRFKMKKPLGRVVPPFDTVVFINQNNRVLQCAQRVAHFLHQRNGLLMRQFLLAIDLVDIAGDDIKVGLKCRR